MAFLDKEKQKKFQREWQKKQRLKRKLEVIDKLGGCCFLCGYNKSIYALQIDHIVPIRRPFSHKLHSLTSGSNLIADIFRGKIKTEDVQLLCANCHCIKTFEEIHLK